MKCPRWILTNFSNNFCGVRVIFFKMPVKSLNSCHGWIMNGWSWTGKQSSSPQKLNLDPTSDRLSASSFPIIPQWIGTQNSWILYECKVPVKRFSTKAPALLTLWWNLTPISPTDRTNSDHFTSHAPHQTVVGTSQNGVNLSLKDSGEVPPKKLQNLPCPQRRSHQYTILSHRKEAGQFCLNFHYSTAKQ
jgi:hypothetical protein